MTFEIKFKLRFLTFKVMDLMAVARESSVTNPTTSHKVGIKRSHTMPFFKTSDEASLYYTDWGAGTPILFLNSLGLGTRMWDYQFAAFAAKGFRCVSLDRRGHGRSDEPAWGYDFDTLADDVAALVEKLDLRSFTLVGHSMGGGEVVRYLTRHGSDRVARVVLLAPATPKMLRDGDNSNGVPRENFEALWHQWKHDYPKWVDDNLAPFFIPETTPAMMRWGAGLIQVSVPVALACSQALAEADFRAEMRAIAVPCLLIHGDRDRSTPIELTGKPTAELLQNCRLVTYEGAPHGLMYTHMDRVNTDMLEFMRET
jgi:non-heme chloroperoxidase